MTGIYTEMEDRIREICSRIAPGVDKSSIKILLPKKGEDFDISTNAAFVMARHLQSTKN